MTMATDLEMERSAVRPGHDAPAADRALIVLLAIVGVFALLALFARIMMEDLRHDEHMFVAAGAVLGKLGLYGEFSYSHLPNLALFLAGLFELVGSDHYLLVARGSLFATWILFLVGMALTAARLAQSRAIGLFAALLLIADQLFVSHVGMIVSNNIYAATLCVYGLLFFLIGLEVKREVLEGQLSSRDQLVLPAAGFLVSAGFLAMEAARFAAAALAGGP